MTQLKGIPLWAWLLLGLIGLGLIGLGLSLSLSLSLSARQDIALIKARQATLELRGTISN
jgi:hypothetical protein